MEHKFRLMMITIIGSIILLIGIILIPVSKNLINNILHKKLSTIPGNPGYTLWRDMNIPIYQEFYFFNVTNVHEILTEGHKPILKEIGPFVYKLNITKGELQFNHDKTIVSYVEKKLFHFQSNKSNHLSLNDKITIINIPLMTIYKIIDTLPKIIRPLIRSMIRTRYNDLFITGTVDEFLFKGHYSRMLCDLRKLLPDKIPSCYFSLMTNQNDTWSKTYEQYTGSNNVELLTSLISFDNSTKLTFWNGDQCNNINGTFNGELYPPADNFGNRKSYEFFRPDFCRKFQITLNKTMTQSDIDKSLYVDRFILDKNSFKNSSEYPPNKCYDVQKNLLSKHDQSSLNNLEKVIKSLDSDWKKLESITDIFKNNKTAQSINTTEYSTIKAAAIQPSGVFDLSICQQGSPIYISLPHFLEANYYEKQIIGMKPDYALHESYVNIEPKTGTPVDFAVRMQINVAVNTDHIDTKMKSVMLPTMWQSLLIHITDEIAETITVQTKQPIIISYTVISLIIIMGSIMLIYTMFVYILYLIHRKHLSNLDDDNETRPILENNNNNNHNHNNNSSTDNTTSNQQQQQPKEQPEEQVST